MSAKNYQEWGRFRTTSEDDTKQKHQWLLDLLRELQGKPIRHYPSSASVINEIISKPEWLPPEDLTGEIAAGNSDDDVYQAFLDLAGKPRRFHTCPDNSELIECPRKRLLRIGDDAERNGNPSELFRYLMELTENGAKLPFVTSRAMSMAQKYLNIAIAFKQFAETNQHKYTNFKDLKCRFRKDREDMHIHVSESTLERALEAHELNWSAYAIDAPRKGQRNKRS